MPPDGSSDTNNDTYVPGSDENVVLPGARRATSVISAAVDASGKRWIAFYDKTHQELRVATKPSGGSWSETGVHSEQRPSRSERALELRLDSEGHPHIGYLIDHRGLVYAHHDGSSWKAEKLESQTSGVDERVELALDSNDRPHLLYSSAARLMHAQLENGSWTRSEVGGRLHLSDTDYRFELSPDGTPYILYSDDATDSELHLATNASGSWENESVLRQNNTSRHLVVGDLRFDRDGDLTVVYADRGDPGGSVAGLVEATKKDGSWNRERISTNGVPVRIPGVAYTKKGRGRILYATYGSKIPGVLSLSVARETASGWTFEKVTEPKTLVQKASVAFSSKSGTNFAYLDERYKNVNWASRKEGTWSSKHVKHERERVTLVTGATVDQKGRLRIGYLTGFPDEIHYAVREGESWKRRPIETEYQRVQQLVSGPVIDSGGKSVFTYADQSRVGLHVARGGTGGWSKSEVAPRVARSGVQLIVDGKNHPHLTYFSIASGTQEFEHAWRTGGSWKTERLQELESNQTRRSRYDVAVDGDGKLHFVTIGNSRNKLLYRTKSNSGWTKTDVSGSWSLQALAPGIGLDNDGRPHVVFTASDGNDVGMVHTRRQKSGWKDEIIAPRFVSNKTEVRTSASGGLLVAGEQHGNITVLESSDGGWIQHSLSYDDSSVDAQTWAVALSPNDEVYVAFADRFRENLVVTGISK